MHDHFPLSFLSSFNGKPCAPGVHHGCMTVNAQLSSSSWSWQASPQDPTAGLPTLSRASPGTIYPFWDSPFALDYLPRSRDSLALQVICPFRDNFTFSSFHFLLFPLHPLDQPLLSGKEHLLTFSFLVLMQHKIISST